MYKSKNILKIIFIITLSTIPLIAQTYEQNIQKLIKKGGVILADENGEILFSINKDLILTPASTQKILLSLTCINYLNLDYKFYTDIFIDNDNNLLVKGYGDPYFVSEDFYPLIKELKSKHISKNINNIYVDDSFFEAGIKIPGKSDSLEPYDTMNDALSVNFNTIFVRREKNGKYVSAEEQTPYINFTEKICKKLLLKPGRSLRVNIGHNKNYPELYFGNLFKYFLKKYNFNVSGKILKHQANNNFKLVLRYYSKKDLKDVLENLLLYSNNFIANQLFLTLPAIKQQPPASLNKSRKFFETFFNYKLMLKHTFFNEGSGLSTNNYTTPEDTLQTLKLFQKYKFLMSYDSTLKCYVKTGTLCNNNSQIGYYKSKIDDKWKIFVILLNQKKFNRNKILKLLKEKY